MIQRYKEFKILVVDDEIETLQDIEEFLASRFKEVFTATNANDALEIFEIEKPDIILTDIVMPNINGLDFIYKIRKQDQNIPIIIYSGYHEDEKLFRAIKLCVTEYLVKPIDSQKLLAALNSSVEKIKMLMPIVNLEQNYKWNSKSSILYKNNSIVHLTKNETKLLNFLIQNINHPVESEAIFYEIWSDFDKEYNAKSIRDLVSKLRKKIPQDLISNLYGGKYILSIKNQDDIDDIYNLNAIELFDNMQNSIMIVNAQKEDLPILYFNRAFLQKLGYESIGELEQRDENISLQLEPFLKNVLQTKQDVDFKLQLKNSTKNLYCKINPIFSKTKKEIKYFLIDCIDENITC